MDARQTLIESSYAGTLKTIDRLEAENLALRRELREVETAGANDRAALAMARAESRRNRRAFLRASCIAAFCALAAWAGWITAFVK